MNIILIKKCVIHLDWVRVLILIYKMWNSFRCMLIGAILTKTNHSLFEVHCKMLFSQTANMWSTYKLFYSIYLIIVKELCVSKNISFFHYCIIFIYIYFVISCQLLIHVLRFIYLCFCFRFAFPFCNFPL